jgi:CheY-like chemotaxis protein
MLGINDRRELPTLLLIDDDLVSREVIATILTLHGYIVHTAADGAASLEMLDSGECAPGAILMDTQLPGLSGLPLIEQLRTRGKAIIIAISGSPAPDDLVAAADGFLPRKRCNAFWKNATRSRQCLSRMQPNRR